MARTAHVELTLKEVQVLRRLIVEEAKRLGHSTYQRAKDEPSKLRRLHSVARKIWNARQSFDGNL
jgi:hypothetical protein